MPSCEYFVGVRLEEIYKDVYISVNSFRVGKSLKGSIAQAQCSINIA